jgi:hypothetical protein
LRLTISDSRVGRTSRIRCRAVTGGEVSDTMGSLTRTMVEAMSAFSAVDENRILGYNYCGLRRMIVSSHPEPLVRRPGFYFSSEEPRMDTDALSDRGRSGQHRCSGGHGVGSGPAASDLGVPGGSRSTFAAKLQMDTREQRFPAVVRAGDRADAAVRAGARRFVSPSAGVEAGGEAYTGTYPEASYPAYPLGPGMAGVSYSLSAAAEAARSAPAPASVRGPVKAQVKARVGATGRGPEQGTLEGAGDGTGEACRERRPEAEVGAGSEAYAHGPPRASPEAVGGTDGSRVFVLERHAIVRRNDVQGQ